MDKTYSTITFGEFASFLLQLGFVDIPTEGGQKLFEQGEDTWILLPSYYTDDTPVRRVHLQAARRLLDERGIIEAADFDQWVSGKELAVAA
jgi:hypothetical protein